MTTPYRQLEMVWPQARLADPPAVHLPPGYSLRTYRPGDEARFYALMALAGWPGWDDVRLRPWAARLLPEGWFMIVEDASGQIVTTAMCLRSETPYFPAGGELGWLAGDPAHYGRGLGLAASAAVTRRFIAAECRHIHLYTEHWRLAALKTYLRLGYAPFLSHPEMPERWRAICEQLGWPYTPQDWPTLPPG